MAGKKRFTKAERADWKSLPIEHWNTLSFTEYFRDMNEERFGVPRDQYAPMRNWSFEQGVINRALAEHGPALLRAAFDECFRTYKPTRQYPLLTAGFAVAYRINGLIPSIRERLRQEAEESTAPEQDYGEVAAWL